MSRFFFVVSFFVFAPIHAAVAIPISDSRNVTPHSTDMLALIGFFALIVLALCWVFTKKSLKNKKFRIVAVSCTLVAFLVFIVAEMPEVQNGYAIFRIKREIGDVWKKYEAINLPTPTLVSRSGLLSATHEILWKDFMEAAGDGKYLVLDIREDYGYEAGHIAGSMQMRFGDLVRGRWKELSQYKESPIYIVCYEGLTGTIAADFLAERGFVLLYRVKGGLLHAVQAEQNFPFIGTTHAPGLYEQKHPLTTYEVKKFFSANTRVVDMRSPSHYDNEIPIEIHYKLLREIMTSEEIRLFVEALPSGMKYLPVCDSELSCYQGELLYEDLMRAGLTPLGVYKVSN